MTKKPGDREVKSEVLDSPQHGKIVRIRVAEYFTNSDGMLDYWPVAISLTLAELDEIYSRAHD